jgi:hypothetical protein
MAAQETVVNEALIDEFQQDGCAVIRGIFAPWIDGLKAGIEENMASPSFRERTYVPDDGSARFFQDFCNWDRIPGYRALVLESPMAMLAARLMRSRTARIFHDHVLVKEPGTSVVTPWHQDQPYYLISAQTVSTAPGSTRATPPKPCPMSRRTAPISTSTAGRSNPATRWCSISARCTARPPTPRRPGAG